MRQRGEKPPPTLRQLAEEGLGRCVVIGGIHFVDPLSLPTLIPYPSKAGQAAGISP